MPSFLNYALFGTIAFFLGVFITRWVFSVNTFLKYQQAQTQLLIEIAKKQGVDEEKIESVKEKVNK